MNLSRTPFLVVFLCFFVLAIDSGEPSRDFLITGSSMGRAKIGQSKREVERLYRDHRVEEVDLLLEGLPSPALEIFQGRELLITAEIEDGKIYRIGTMNPRLATWAGIRVGSTLDEAKRQYGEPRYIDWGEGGIYAIFPVESETLSLRLHIENPSAGYSTAEEYVTDKSRIEEILAVGR